MRWSLSCWKVPLLVKIPYTLFIGLLVPAYWRHYGLANFLWFSDVALLTTLIALWLESPLLASMQAVSVALLELAWLVDFSGRLLAGTQLIGLAEYMFKRDIPLFVRGLSLFHVWLPFLLLWLVYRLGYDERAWVAQTLLAWVVLLLCYFLTKPSENINWAFGPGNKAQTRMAPGLYLILIMAFFPACIYFPTHLVLKATMPRQLYKGNLPLWREGEGWPPKILIERLDATGAGGASCRGCR